ncbi:MAG: T9SS type A sorting domain-containing protein [Ignavibacteria bacterium]|nr:T9SS type A sorting domain-containing protein [Ignavibacteria bacterium]
MKTILLVIAMCSFYVQSVNSQWQLVLNASSVYSMTAYSSIIFAGTNSGVYRSVDNGVSWSPTSFNVTQPVHAMTNSQNVILAGTSSGHGVYYSTNFGSTWVQSSLNNKVVRSLGSSSDGSPYVYAGTHSFGVYKSTNYGLNWTQTTLNNRDVYSLAVSQYQVFAGTTNSSGVYVSDNDGTSWSPTSLNNQNVYALAVTLPPTNYVYAGTSNGVFRSTNNGSTWTQTLYNFTKALLVRGDSVFAGTSSSGIYLSTNYGVNWSQLNQGLGNGNATSIGGFCKTSFNPPNINYEFAGCDGTSGTGLYRTSTTFTGITPVKSQMPTGFSLGQNYPNPFNPVTNIEFSILGSGFVKLAIFDITGRELETLVNENLNAGTYNADWNAENFSSGVYFYRIETVEFTETKKMVLLK